MSEGWKPVTGYEDRYEVSDFGRVRSLTVAECILRPSPRNRGHLMVNLHRGKPYKSKYVHRLVLEAFVGPCPPGMETCHNNGDPTDNRLINLRWDTLSANRMDRAKHGSSNRGERCGMAKYTERQVLRFIAQLADGFSVKRAAEQCQIGTVQAYNISKGRSWGHLWRQSWSI